MSDLFPELIDQDQDTDIPDMLHVRSFVPDRTLCGAVRPDRPTVWSAVECVVCADLLRANPEMRKALHLFWGGA